jgi:hypothetical protein
MQQSFFREDAIDGVTSLKLTFLSDRPLVDSRTHCRSIEPVDSHHWKAQELRHSQVDILVAVESNNHRDEKKDGEHAYGARPKVCLIAGLSLMHHRLLSRY